ncbi:MAG: hypothetical protein Q9181_001506 [Wetmoreana brouardii]
MLHHKATDKARHYLDLLDTARCLHLTAQAEYQVANHASARPSTTSTTTTRLSQLVPGLLSASQEGITYPEDAFQARICLGWLQSTINEPALALQTLPLNIHDAYKNLGGGGVTVSGWTRENADNTAEALRSYEAILPHVASTVSSSHFSQHREWTERLLIRHCILSNLMSKTAVDEGNELPYSNAALAPFRVWAEFWSNTSEVTSSGGSDRFKLPRSTSRRQIWQLYYYTLSAILQKGTSYPDRTLLPSRSAKEMSTESVRSLGNSKLQQSAELRWVENTYEDILLNEVSFPKANEANVEVESWADQVMANWRVVSGPAWQNEDLGRGGKLALTRNILAILYRAATRTFHSTRILRHLFIIHTALAEFRLAATAFDTYIELVRRGRARVEKSRESELGLDDDDTVLKTTAAGIEMLCFYGRRRQIERAQEIAVILENWLEKIQSPTELTVSADDNPNDLKTKPKQPGQPVSGEALAAAHRSLGICRAHWARLTYDILSRPKLQSRAVASFRAALKPTVTNKIYSEIYYDLSLLLAETRDIDSAIEAVKKAISLCADESDEESQDDRTDIYDQQEVKKRRTLFRAWHLLAFLLSARHDFETAIESCDAAYELYADILGSSEQYRPAERLSRSDRESILELKMTQLAISQILDGPGEAVNGSGELLSVYKELFDYSGGPKNVQPPTVEPLSKEAMSPPRSANGTVRSSRRSLLGRSKEAVGNLPGRGHHSHRDLTTDGLTESAGKPAISVTHDRTTSERKYQPPHHLARQESKKLHKRHSRKSMASDRRSRGVSPNKSPLANGSEAPAQALPLRVATMKRSSLEVPSGGSSLGDGAQFSVDVGVASTNNVPSHHKPGSSGQTSFRQLPPTTAHSTHHKNQNIAPEYPKPPPSASFKPSPISTHSMHPLPDPIYPSSDLKLHAFTLLTRIWLLIAQLYRDAAMPVDAQGALSEAFSQAQSMEALVASTDSSAEALSTPGWGDLKSIAEIWADIHAEQAALHLQLANAEKASEEFEKAIGWFPDHNAATVGLSNLLLDYYSQKAPASKTAETSEEWPMPQPMLACLPPNKSSEAGPVEGDNSRADDSPTLLSRLAARDRAYGLLSMLTKSGRGWADSEAWFALARADEESGQVEKAKEALWWVVELEEGRPTASQFSSIYSRKGLYSVSHAGKRMSEKKRKRASHDAGDRLPKKLNIEETPVDVVKVIFTPDEDGWAPILKGYSSSASTPGLTLPPNLPLRLYKKPRKNDTSSIGRPTIGESEYLLHTSAHPKIDYVGREEAVEEAQGLLKHYIGIFDERTGKLELTRAKRLVLRGNVRAGKDDGEERVKGHLGLSARNTLGLEFGSKRSQRAIEALTKNAISPLKTGRAAPGSSQPSLDPVASAVVSSMAATASMPTREALQAAADESKPRPQPNLGAERPTDVYPIDQLVGSGILRQMTIKEWQDAVESREEILTKSRFVSNRVHKVVPSGDVRKIKTLKYLLLLLEWHGVLFAMGKGGGRKVPEREQLREQLGAWGSELIKQVSNRFAEGGRLVSRWQLDNLITHICALALTVDDFTTDVYDIKEDLRLENKDIRKYFREIGARVVSPTEVERARLKIGKAEAAAHQLAKLRLPLDFPKMRMAEPVPSAQEVLNQIHSDYIVEVNAGNYHPFVWPYGALGAYLLIFYLLLPPTQSRVFHLARYPLFFLIIYLSVRAIRECRSPAVTVGYGIGLLNAWTILWSATLIIFNDGRRDYKRIERQERDDIQAINDQGLLQNIQGETTALDGSTTDGLKSLHPIAQVPREPVDDGKKVPLVESPEIFAAQEPIPSDSQQTYVWQSLPGTFVHRLDFILDLVTNFRAVRWTHQTPGTFPPPPHVRDTLTDPSPPPPLSPDKYPTYRTLFTTNFWSFVLCSLSLDTLKYITSLDPYFQGQSKTSPSPFPASRATRLVVSVLFVYTSLLNIFLLAPLGLACVLGPSVLGPHASTWLYPSYFGPLSQISEKGLAGLWGGWWHQLFRYAFEAAGEFIGGTCLQLPKKSIPGGVVRVTVAFLCSGLLHASASYTALRTTYPIKGSFLFFAVQPIGIMGQRALSMWLKKEGYREAIPPWMRGIGNVVVVLAWCWITGPLIADDFAATGVWLYEPLPVSLIRGLRGEGWWRWGGQWITLAEQSSDEEVPQPTGALPTAAAARQAQLARLQAIAEDSMNNFLGDAEVQRVITRRYWDVDPRGRPSLDEVHQQIVHLLSLSGNLVAPRDSIIALAQAGWNEALAYQQIAQLRRTNLRHAITNAPNPPSRTERRHVGPSQTESSHSKQAKGQLLTKDITLSLELLHSCPTTFHTISDVDTGKEPKPQDNDDDLPLPESVEVIEVDDPKRPGATARAVYHQDIRRYLIQRDVQRYGHYRYSRKQGKTLEDRTAPHPDQLDWRFDKRSHFPDILFQWKSEGRPNPTYLLGEMYWRQHLVVDTDRNPIRDFEHLPSTLARDVEPGLLEALERSDPRVRHQDLAARQIRKPLRFPTPRHLKNDDNRLAQQMRRFREWNCLIPWSDKRSGSQAFNSHVENILSEEDKKENTTRNLRRLIESEYYRLKLENAGKYPDRSRHKTEAKKKKYMDELEAKYQKALAKEAKKLAAGKSLYESDASHELLLSDDLTDSGDETDGDEAVGPEDSRGVIAVSDEQQGYLQEAIMPTIYHYARLSGQTPRRILWTTTYWTLYFDFRRQLRQALNLPANAPDPPLVGLSRWAGGIANFRTATEQMDPDKHMDSS